MFHVRQRWGFALTLTVPTCLLIMSSGSLLTAESIPGDEPAVFRLRTPDDPALPRSGLLESNSGSGDVRLSGADEPVWLTGNLDTLADDAIALPHDESRSPYEDYQLDRAGFYAETQLPVTIRDRQLVWEPRAREVPAVGRAARHCAKAVRKLCESCLWRVPDMMGEQFSGVSFSVIRCCDQSA